MTDKLIEQLRDEDSYYRVQEKHWCIDAEELERQRQAAADRIEAQAAEIETLKTMIFATGEAAAVNLRTAMERAAEIERLREALGKLAPMVDWMPHPDCVTAEQIIRAALGEADR